MDAIGGLLLTIALLGLLLGLIKPSLVIWWGSNKTRARVLLTYGLIFVVGAGIAIIWAPTDLEAGKTALEAKNYKEAVARLGAVPSTDSSYSEAQRLLSEAKNNLLMSKLEAAEAASLAGDHKKVITLLSDYPKSGAGSLDAAKILDESREALADAERESAEQAKQKVAEQKSEATQRQAQEKAEATAREQAQASTSIIQQVYDLCAADQVEIEMTSWGSDPANNHALAVERIYALHQAKASAKEMCTCVVQPLKDGKEAIESDFMSEASFYKKMQFVCSVNSGLGEFLKQSGS